MDIPENVLHNLTKLKTAPVSKLVAGNYMGRIDEYDTELIIGTLKDSPREKAARLKRFGIK